MKILQADDHELFRDGVRYILARLDKDKPLIVESHDYQSTILKLRDNPDLDLVLLDLDMPGMQGTEGLRKITERFPTIPVVVLSGSERAHDIDESLDYGASGFVPKSSPSEVLLAALKLVLAGGIYAPRAVRTQIPTEESRGSGRPLTRRQMEILSCIAEGMSNKVIAKRLFLSESTIKGHVRGLLQVLGVGNRVQAINKARELGHLEN